MASTTCGEKKTRIQCKACPWRKDVVATKDIPGGYSKEKHRGLKATIAVPGDARGAFNPPRLMACHESGRGAEVVCVGWLHNQLGVGNNIGVRLQAMTGAFPQHKVVGEQHKRFEDTLGEET